MDFGQFEALASKVEHAVGIIEQLRREKQELARELDGSRDRIGDLEGRLRDKDGELDHLRQELEGKSAHIHMASDRIRDLVSRLESALA